MKSRRARLLAIPAAALCCLGVSWSAGAQDLRFERIATFFVCENTSCDREEVEETVAEIVAVTDDGNTLVYTDGEAENIGFVDISDPENPTGLGTADIDGEPTSVAVADGHALVGVNTSQSFTEPSGFLAVFDIAACVADPETCTPELTLDMMGQPDSVAVSPDARFAAIAIENERDEDIVVDGVEGGLPQLPGGFLNVVDLVGAPANWSVRTVDLTGLSALAPSDPEPEFVDINRFNLAVVSLQENNHVAVVDLRRGRVLTDFDAGAVTLDEVDVEENRLIDLDGTLTAAPREPDAMAWLGAFRIVSANEGDLFGGSRGFTVFNPFGLALFDSGVDFEHLGVAHGHFPERRADAKGTEPEGLETARFGGQNVLFVGSERGNYVAVYHDRGRRRAPEFVQLLPAGIGPEGLLAIPSRGLFVVASEDDEEVRSQITVFALRAAPASYPTILSGPAQAGAEAPAPPIGWGALSALAGDLQDPDILYTVHDSFYDRSRIYVTDLSEDPPVIVEERVLSRDGQPVNLDLEGIARREAGGFWVASEGRGTVGDPDRPVESLNLLVQVEDDGTVVREVELPAPLNDQQRRWGLEGVTSVGSGDDELVYVCFQREWLDDPQGLVKIGRYRPATDEWRFFHYPLDPVESPAGGWVGLSEIVAVTPRLLAVIERDNQGGPDARIKRIYGFSVRGVQPAPVGGNLPVLNKVLVRDVLPDLQAPGGWVQEKLEGLGITADLQVYMVTDNDGVDDNTGETQLIRLR